MAIEIDRKIAADTAALADIAVGGLESEASRFSSILNSH